MVKSSLCVPESPRTKTLQTLSFVRYLFWCTPRKLSGPQDTAYVTWFQIFVTFLWRRRGPFLHSGDITEDFNGFSEAFHHFASVWMHLNSSSLVQVEWMHFSPFKTLLTVLALFSRLKHWEPPIDSQLKVLRDTEPNICWKFVHQVLSVAFDKCIWKEG